MGEFDVAVLSDGFINLDAGALMGVVPRVMWESTLGSKNVDAENRTRLALNCMVVRRGDEVLIVDTGMGNKHDERVRRRLFPGDYGWLLGGLSALGLEPRDVTAVANTHLHADHCGWNTVKESGDARPTFSRARYFVQSGEFDQAMNPNERTRGTYFEDNYSPLAGTGQLELVDGERELLRGVTFVPAPGHTADHAAVTLSSGGQTAIFCGDIAQHVSQFERLAWIASFDVLPLVSLETKRTLLEKAIRDRSLLVSPHLEFPGTGHIIDDGGRRRFVAE